jgi:hypothetical protein
MKWFMGHKLPYLGAIPVSVTHINFNTKKGELWKTVKNTDSKIDRPIAGYMCCSLYEGNQWRGLKSSFSFTKPCMLA